MYPPILVFALCLVDAAVSSGGDEAEDGVLVGDTFASRVALCAVDPHWVSDKEITGGVEHVVNIGRVRMWSAGKRSFEEPRRESWEWCVPSTARC